ncbi:MAG TPA: triple tyrosine motif-containing protein, partial [Phnomibacter sp.]|nr:triple tyrosine motif-containing protein [Phnomibacter sp.]
PQIILSSVHALGRTDTVIHYGFVSTDIETKKPQLPYRYNSLHIEYSAPAYGFQGNMDYSYILEGYDKEWSKWSPKPEKDYTNLPNGSYVFKVKCRSNLGVESDITSFGFSIAPPWYRSWPALSFYFILAAFGIYLLYYYHKKKLARQKEKYEEKQEQLRVLHQLEMEKNEKEIIRLQNEKLASEISNKSRELADSNMHLVERSDALVKVKETIQRLYKYDSTNTDLKRALHLLNDIERNDSEWDRFAASFDEVNNNFLSDLKAKFPALTNHDLKLCAYLQLNLSSKEIAQLLNISIRGVEIGRYRLRKKLGIPTEVAINEFLKEAVRTADPQ